MAATTLIYCAERNRRFTDIARLAGFEIGAQLPNRIYSPPLYFADQDWRKPDRDVYMAELRKWQPHMATVLDLEREEQFDEVLSWAEEAAAIVRVVIIIPKYCGAVERLPRFINGREVRLGYSVPTKFAGTSVPAWEFADWPVHLLGGSPHAQMKLAHYMDVRSTDGNMANLMAHRCRFWSAKRGTNGHWWQLRDTGDVRMQDANYEAFRRSCANIAQMWRVNGAARVLREDVLRSGQE